ncbi:MAG: hypothetical protein AB1813_11495 [Verrucomicrobiota bacterium]
MPIGLFLLAALIFTVVGAPILVLTWMLDGQFHLSVVTLLLWCAWLPWSVILWRWMLQGIEYSNL